MATAGFCVGTMSTQNGWETKSPEEALSLHFTYWFTSRRSQGKVKDKVQSFYYLFATYGTIQEELIDKTKEELEGYLKELFPQSSVSVNFENLEGKTSQYRLIIGARVIYEGQTYSLAQTILVMGEKYRVLDNKRLGRNGS